MKSTCRDTRATDSIIKSGQKDDETSILVTCHFRHALLEEAYTIAKSNMQIYFTPTLTRRNFYRCDNCDYCEAMVWALRNKMKISLYAFSTNWFT